MSHCAWEIQVTYQKWVNVLCIRKADFIPKIRENKLIINTDDNRRNKEKAK